MHSQQQLAKSSKSGWVSSTTRVIIKVTITSKVSLVTITSTERAIMRLAQATRETGFPHDHGTMTRQQFHQQSSSKGPQARYNDKVLTRLQCKQAKRKPSQHEQPMTNNHSANLRSSNKINTSLDRMIQLIISRKESSRDLK